MPNYAKFMKSILTKKKRLEDFEMVAMTEECSVVLQHKLPQKFKDPDSFTIPCSISDALFDQSLCDLSTSIDLVPLSIFSKLGLPGAKPTNILL